MQTIATTLGTSLEEKVSRWELAGWLRVVALEAGTKGLELVRTTSPPLSTQMGILQVILWLRPSLRTRGQGPRGW